MRFRAFRVDWDTLFFSKIFVSAKRKTRASEASQMRACWSAWLYQSFIKKSFSAIILFFRNCICCERLWLLRPSNLVVTVFLWPQIRLSVPLSLSPRLSPRLSLSLSLRLSCLFLCNYLLDFDETWWKCWNLNPIDCIRILLRYAAQPLRYARSVMGQRGNFFFAFLCFSENFGSTETHFFLSKIFVRAKRKTCASEASKLRACWSDLLYQS